jgi:hypothetical protein
MNDRPLSLQCDADWTCEVPWIGTQPYTFTARNTIWGMLTFVPIRIPLVLRPVTPSLDRNSKSGIKMIVPVAALWRRSNREPIIPPQHSFPKAEATL